MDIPQSIIEAQRAGARTRKEIAVATGLDPSIVDAAVDILIRSGGLQPAKLKGPCATVSCSSCGEDDACHPADSVVRISLGPTRTRD